MQKKQLQLYIPDVTCISSLWSYHKSTYINLVSESIPLNGRASPKHVSGLRDDSVHTVKRQGGGSLRSCEPYSSICLFIS